jgi:guanosine-3',5'-bis(diphosphate) 3'-pyrophosphohydrolase
MNNILKAIAFAAKAHGEQKRKYTGEPYIVHPIAVAQILGNIFPDYVIIAAILHDTVEDTPATPQSISENFGYKVAGLVKELTDVFTKEEYPGLNRAQRKSCECDRIATISFEAKSIKLADLIDNTESIVLHDPGFAKTYLAEKQDMLRVLSDGHAGLYESCVRSLNRGLLAIEEPKDTNLGTEKIELIKEALKSKWDEK